MEGLLDQEHVAPMPSWEEVCVMLAVDSPIVGGAGAVCDRPGAGGVSVDACQCVPYISSSFHHHYHATWKSTYRQWSNTTAHHRAGAAASGGTPR